MFYQQYGLSGRLDRRGPGTGGGCRQTTGGGSAILAC